MPSSATYTPLTPLPTHRSPTIHKSTTFLSRLVRLTRLTCLIPLLLLSVSLLTISLLAYLSPTRGYSRPCLPFSFARISSSAHKTLSCEALGAMSGSGGQGSPDVPKSDRRLAGFLATQKEAFMADAKAGNLSGWTIAMGNEAGGESRITGVEYQTTSLIIHRPRLGSIVHRPVLPLFHTPIQTHHSPRSNSVYTHVTQT